MYVHSNVGAATLLQARRALHNVLIWIDILLNKKTYIRQMQRNGFIVGSYTTRREIYLFYRWKGEDE